MTASGASQAPGTRRPAAGPNGSAGPSRPADTAGAERESPGDGAAWTGAIEWAADRIVPTLAPTGLISVFPAPTGDHDGVPSRPSHYLIRVDGDRERPSTITPITSRALDIHEPFGRVAGGDPQLWPIDGSLVQLFAPGSSAIAAPLAVGASARAALTLFRAPDAAPFSLDDLMRLEALVSAMPESAISIGDVTSGGNQLWQPAVLTPSAHVLGLRDLMRDLIDGDTPYDVARRFARAAQGFFEAQSCVVYFVEPGQPAQGDPSTPGSAGPGTRPRLQLAASVGSGVLLTPPWLEPMASASPGTLFASGPGGTVLMATLPDEGPWVGRTATDDVLVALPLRSDGELVAILGMRGPDRLTKMQTITAENFAVIGANALLIARRRDADQSSILVLRSELARNRLAHDATIAMFGAADVASGLNTHAHLLVPGLADGYLVYLSAGSEDGRASDGPDRIYSKWREHEDVASQARFEVWIDHRLAPLLSSDHPEAVLPLLLSDVSAGSDPQMPGNAIAPPGAIRSLAAVPLVRDGATFGALVLVATEHVRRYGQRDVALIASLAEPVARLLSAEKSRSQPLHGPADVTAANLWAESGDATLIAGLATRFIGPIEIDDIIRLTSQALASHLRDWCVVEIPAVDGDLPVLSGAHADPGREWPRPLWALLSQNRDALRGPAKVLRSGQSDLSLTVDWVNAVSEHDQDGQSLCPALIPASSISAPILSGDQTVIGTITCFRTRPASSFTLDDLATVELVASIAGDAIAVARTRRSEREAGLRQHWLAEQRTQLMAQLADGVIVIDQRHQIAFANDQAQSIHGGIDLPATVSDYLATYQPREINGTPFTEQTFPLTIALQTETRQHGIWRMRLRDDVTVTVVAAVSPVRSEDGSVSGAVLSLHDVTAIYEQEQVRQHYLVEISDEIRSPIASIKGWSQYLAQRTEIPGETTLDSRAVDAISRQARLLQQLVERLITASRSSVVEDVAHEVRALDVRVLLGHIVHTFQQLSPHRVITLAAPHDGQVLGRWDPEAIRRIFGNLITNAISSSPDGSPVEIAVERKPGRIAVSVTDHGPGIAPDRQLAIFEQRGFFGSDPVVEPESIAGPDRDDPPSAASELGLDLHTVAKLVRRLHGQISVRSTLGAGSTFTVELPLDQ